jgi:hypothetical protein
VKENVARRPRFKRTTAFAATRLTERDKAIIAAVSRYRFLTTSLILSLVPGSRQNVTRRLQRLFHAGFLDRPRAQLPLRYSGEISEIVYCPTSKAGMGRGYKPVTSLFLAHALAVSETLIRIELDCLTQRVHFISEHEILAATADSDTRHFQWRVQVKTDTTKEQIGIIPDGAFAIERTDAGATPRRLYFFLEVGRTSRSPSPSPSSMRITRISPSAASPQILLPLLALAFATRGFYEVTRQSRSTTRPATLSPTLDVGQERLRKAKANTSCPRDLRKALSFSISTGR